MGERVFKVCDAKTSGGRSTCDERNTKTCVVCERDFCPTHRSDTELYVTIAGTNHTAHNVNIGIVCHTCREAIAHKIVITDLFAEITTERIIHRTRAHVAGDALK